MPRRLGDQTVRILGCVLHQDRTALEIAEHLGLSKAGIYTQVARCVDAGWLHGYFREADLAKRRGRPRRYYTLTGAGEQVFRGFDFLGDFA